MSASATKRPARPAGRRGPGTRGGAQRRSAARLAAVQALYQVEIGGATPERVIHEFLDLRLNEEVDGVRLAEADRRLLADLVRGVSAERGELDDMLAAVLDEDWPVERLEMLVLTVLRAGAYELAERRDVPVRVVISEYVAVADAFFAGKEPGMVNGVLDRLARALRPEEFAADRPAPPGSGSA